MYSKRKTILEGLGVDEFINSTCGDRRENNIMTACDFMTVNYEPL